MSKQRLLSKVPKQLLYIIFLVHAVLSFHAGAYIRS